MPQPQPMQRADEYDDDEDGDDRRTDGVAATIARRCSRWATIASRNTASPIHSPSSMATPSTASATWLRTATARRATSSRRRWKAPRGPGKESAAGRPSTAQWRRAAFPPARPSRRRRGAVVGRKAGRSLPRAGGHGSRSRAAQPQAQPAQPQPMPVTVTEDLVYRSGEDGRFRPLRSLASRPLPMATFSSLRRGLARRARAPNTRSACAILDFETRLSKGQPARARLGAGPARQGGLSNESGNLASERVRSFIQSAQTRAGAVAQPPAVHPRASAQGVCWTTRKVSPRGLINRSGGNSRMALAAVEGAGRSAPR